MIKYKGSATKERVLGDVEQPLSTTEDATRPVYLI